MARRRFQLICEVEPATRPDLVRVRHQIGVLGPIASAFLVPDNHIGRATVSSIAVAHEVARMGGRAIACLNARDRNVLGFRRDLLTAAAYGVDELLFVYGDRPESGRRSDDLTVRTMISAAREFDGAPRGGRFFTVGVTSRLVPVPPWKAEADFIIAQVGYDVGELAAWRQSIEVRCPVFAGVLVVTSTGMARKLTSTIPQLAIPGGVVDSIENDPEAGIAIACELVEAIRATNLFDGVHLIPLGRYREVAHRLEPLLAD
jgi:methylenetetrahydrofolate reductase (NADPH)